MLRPSRFSVLAIASLLVMAFAPPSFAQQAQHMEPPTVRSAKELARWYFEEALNRGNTSAAEQMLSPNFTLYVPPSLADGPVVQGPEAFKQLVAGLRAVFPDLRFTLHDQVAEGGLAMVSMTMEGTHRGEWLGVPATGRKVSMTGVDLFRVVEGRIEQVRIQADYLGALQQLGAIPKR